MTGNGPTGEQPTSFLLKRSAAIVAVMIVMKLIGDWLDPAPESAVVTLMGIALVILGCIVMIDSIRLFRRLGDWLLPPPGDR